VDKLYPASGEGRGVSHITHIARCHGLGPRDQSPEQETICQLGGPYLSNQTKRFQTLASTTPPLPICLLVKLIRDHHTAPSSCHNVEDEK